MIIINKIVTIRDITKEDAKKEIIALINTIDTKFYPDEISDKLCIDFELTMEIFNELIKDEVVEINE